MAQNNEFYPPIEPYRSDFIKVSDVHRLHFEECGNPQGTPILFVHGGPGGGTDPDHRRYFDPQHYRIILFDQRGCGKSTPSASLEENTTWDLVADMEKLREHLGLKKWILFGGSWGSTLSLAYGITHPERVAHFVLRGIFLCRPSEIHWFYQEGASQIFPDYWQEYLEFIPESERRQLVKAYHARLTSTDPHLRLRAAKIWSQWEAATSRLIVDPSSIAEFENPDKALAFARIECHYFMNNAFFVGNNFLLDNIHRCAHISADIVQGRYDVVCPPRSAWELHKLWPKSKLRWIPDAGHAASEPNTRKVLVECTDSCRSISFSY